MTGLNALSTRLNWPDYIGLTTLLVPLQRFFSAYHFPAITL